MRARFVLLILVACGVGALGAACFSEADNCVETDSCGSPDAGAVDTGNRIDTDAGASDAVATATRGTGTQRA